MSARFWGAGFAFLLASLVVPEPYSLWASAAGCICILACLFVQRRDP